MSELVSEVTDSGLNNPPSPVGELSKGSIKVESAKKDEIDVSLSKISDTICRLSKVDSSELVEGEDAPLVGYRGSCLGDLGGVGRSSNFFQISSEGAGAS